VVRRRWRVFAGSLPCERESFVSGRRAPRYTPSNRRDLTVLCSTWARVIETSLTRRKYVVVVVRRRLAGVCWLAALRAPQLRLRPASPTLHALESVGLNRFLDVEILRYRSDSIDRTCVAGSSMVLRFGAGRASRLLAVDQRAGGTAQQRY
jgi:hypothetical protein